MSRSSIPLYIFAQIFLANRKAEDKLCRLLSTREVSSGLIRKIQVAAVTCCGILRSLALVVRKERIVQGLREAGKQAGEGSHRYAQVGSGRGGNSRGRSPPGDISTEY